MSSQKALPVDQRPPKDKPVKEDKAVKEKAVTDAKIRYAELARDLVDPPPAPRQIAAE